MADYPLINGFAYDWSSVELAVQRVDGSGGAAPKFRGFKSLNYDSSSTGEKLYGTGAQPLARTRGRAEYTCSLTMHEHEWPTLLNFLGDGYGERAVKIVAQWRDGKSGSKKKVEITGHISKSAMSAAEGHPERSIDIDPLTVVENDKTLLGR